MASFMKRALAALWVLTFAAALHAASVEKDLEGVKKKIAKEKQGIVRAQRQEGSLIKSLEKIEGELERKTSELKEANSKLTSIAAELQAKQAQVAALEGSIEKRRHWLKQRAVALYRWHRSGSPFMILSGDVSLGTLMQRRRYLEAALSFDNELVTRLSEEAQAQQELHEELAQKKRRAG
jgi:septal ring factor EnvC (AmiA/AmiB activator)